VLRRKYVYFIIWRACFGALAVYSLIALVTNARYVCVCVCVCVCYIGRVQKLRLRRRDNNGIWRTVHDSLRVSELMGRACRIMCYIVAGERFILVIAGPLRLVWHFWSAVVCVIVISLGERGDASPILCVYCDLIYRIAGWHWAQYCSNCITLISRGFVVHFMLQIRSTSKYPVMEFGLPSSSSIVHSCTHTDTEIP